MIPSDGGRFEISVDDELIYSKLESGEFPDASSIARQLSKRAAAAR